MKLIRLDSAKEINRLADGEFLQSWFWGEIIGKNGETLKRYGVVEGGEILAAASMVKRPLFGPFFYWYVPRGPIGEKRAVEFLLEELKKDKTGGIFLRIEPQKALLMKKGRANLKKSLDLQPKKTLFLDLNFREEELLKAMHQKTRYNIKLSEKKGVKIVEAGPEDFDEFWRLMKLTGDRDGFRLHKAEHYQNLLKASKFIKLYFASYGGKNIAAGLFCFFGNRATYLHGASDNEARNLMAPYLLQWEIIKIARREGFKYYDFYGIDEKKWPGVTRFKLGFGGRVREYPGTFDFIFRPAVYSLYGLLRKARRILR